MTKNCEHDEAGDIKVIVNIPHDGNVIPYEYADFIGNPTYMGDYGASFLFSYDWAAVLKFPINRIICDVERFEDKDKEPMEKLGMGVCYTRNANCEPMRIVPDKQRAEIIAKYYRPYHKKLSRLVEDELSVYGNCLIIDGHTFSSVKRPYEPDEAKPQICIGYDEHVQKDKEIGRYAARRLLQLGYDVMENRPFSGAIKPLDMINDKRVMSIMFEVRQDMLTKYVRNDLETVAKELCHMAYNCEDSMYVRD